MTADRERPCRLVVFGLGYVGLPVCREACRAGMAVTGVDVDAARVATLAAGRSPVDDVPAADVAAMLAAGFCATTSPEAVAEADVVVICVPTPLDGDGTPDLAAVRATAETIAPRLGAGTLVVLESTTWPGTTEEVLVPILEAGSGMTAGEEFHVAFSPERIDPANPTWGLANTPKVVGGLTEACTKAAEAFYSRFVCQVVTTRGPREAEMAKLIENTYRHVNIALVNEMAVFCHEMGIDLWDAIAAASTKPFGFQAFHPGPGVGGHCIPIDPGYLSWRVRSLGYPFRFVELATEINARMPSYVVARITRLLNDRGLPVRGTPITLIGVTYKPDVSDTRETPARPIARQLCDLGANLRLADPHVDHLDLGGRRLPVTRDLSAAVDGTELAVVLQHHRRWDLDRALAGVPAVFDTRGRLRGDNVEAL